MVKSRCMTGPVGATLTTPPGITQQIPPMPGQGIDPLQANDPWRNMFHSVSGQVPNFQMSSGSTDGSYQTGFSSVPSTATFAMPSGYLDGSNPGLSSGRAGFPSVNPSQGPSFVTGAPGVGPQGLPPGTDPVLIQLMQQQMQMNNPLISMLSRTHVPTPAPAASSAVSSSDRGFDQKWLPACPQPQFKSWNTRVRELSGFREWLERFTGWLSFVNDHFGPEIRESIGMDTEVIISGANPEQATRSKRLFYLVQQSFSGCSKVENMIKSQNATKGISDANGYELLRLIRREYSLMTRQEALHYRYQTGRQWLVWLFVCCNCSKM